jgi:hypothetical protein
MSALPPKADIGCAPWDVYEYATKLLPRPRNRKCWLGRDSIL